jgi:Domain of unknown function (DUF3883)
MDDWSVDEVHAIISDYLHMLSLELAGQSYNKSEHRASLKSRLNNRTDGSIEFKHCNISAALIELGFPSIRGYKPRANFQALLIDILQKQLLANKPLDQLALAAVEQPAVLPTVAAFSKIKTEAPVYHLAAREAIRLGVTKAFKRDYLAREAANSSLGLAGEELVVNYEHWRLNALGLSRLADQVEHVSKTKGDGLGYDILSFEPDGKERFIEVKTTSFAKETPFFVSRGELALSRTAKEQFHLYRLYHFRQEPKLFELSGQLDLHCLLDPVTYRASFPQAASSI